LDRLQASLLKEGPETTIARIHLSGRVSGDTYSYRQEIYNPGFIVMRKASS
jgi:hypothetical protein